MTDHQGAELRGRVTDVFGHRFVIQASDGSRTLADLGPEGLRAFPIEVGIEVAATGEAKPSELRVSRIARPGHAAVNIRRGKPPQGDHRGGREASVALDAVRGAGFEPIGEPRRKPKHFEVLVRKGGALVECHIEDDGRIRKEKPVAAGDGKWSSEIATLA